MPSVKTRDDRQDNQPSLATESAAEDALAVQQLDDSLADPLFAPVQMDDTAGGPAVQMDDDEETGSTLDRLRAASEGNWIGDVDEGNCLSLMNSLTPDEKATVRGDRGLMGRLAGALDETEIVQAVRVLDFELKWQAYWIIQANEASSIGPVAWQGLLVAAPAQEQAEFIGWQDVFTTAKEHMGVHPTLGFALLKADAAKWTYVLTHYSWFVTWILETLPGQQAVLEFGAAAVDPTAMVPALVSGGNWDRLLNGLPRGSAIPQDARAAIRRLVDGCTIDQAKQLFLIRFTVPANDTSAATWNLNSLKAVWDGINLLPDQDVTENTVITQFESITGSISFAPGGSTGPIQMGQALTPAEIPGIVRHEVGHTVHEMNKSTVDAWLEKEMDYWYFGSGEGAARQWINDLGGFGANDTDAEKDRAVELLNEFMGPGSRWEGMAADMTTYITDNGTAADQTIWDDMPAAVDNAVDMCPADWYTNYVNFQTGPKGRYSMCYWYSRYTYMGDTAKAVVDITDSYSAMAPDELFANCYSAYFSDPAGYNDHSIWGTNPALPDSVKTFFHDHILERQPYEPPAAAGGAADAAAGAAGGAAAPRR